MCYWVLPANGIPIAQSTVSPILPEEHTEDSVKEKLLKFDDSITQKLSISTEVKDDVLDYFATYYDNEQDHLAPEVEPVEHPMPEADDRDPESFDQYISAEVLLPKGDSQLLGRVIDRKRDIHRNPIGKVHSNPIFDTCIYQV